jgi:hypothetical protein
VPPTENALHEAIQLGGVLPEGNVGGPNQHLTNFLQNDFNANRMPNVVLRNNDFLTALASLGRGYTLSPSPNFSLLGLSVRELCLCLEEMLLDPYEYYISANAVDLHAYYRSRIYFRGQHVTLTSLCLGDIDPVTIDSFNTIRAGSGETLEDLQDYFVYIRDALVDAVDGETGGGSDLASYILLDNIRISRRVPYNRLRPIHEQRRTAGFDRLIPWNVEERQEMERVVKVDAGEYGGFVPANTFLFVPGGEENCILSCVKRGLLAMEEDVANRMYGVFFDEDARRYVINARVDDMYASLKEEWVQERFRTSASTVQEIGADRFRKRQEKRFYDMTKHGFSPFMFKKFQQKVLDEQDIYVHLVHVVHVPNKEEDLSRPTLSREEITQRARRGEMLLLQVGVDGSFVVTNKAADAVSEKNMLAHAVLCHPFPGALMKTIYANHSADEFCWEMCHDYPMPGSVNPRTVYRTMKEFLLGKDRFVETSIKEIFAKFKKMSNPSVLYQKEIADMPKLVEEQNMRYRNIFMKKATNTSLQQVLDSSAEDQQVEEEEEGGGGFVNAPNFSSKTGVIVYDLETVENLRGVQDEIVYEKVRKIKPNSYEINHLDPNLYTVPEAQIPYTVQWGVFRDEETSARDEEAYSLNTTFLEGSEGIHMSNDVREPNLFYVNFRDNVQQDKKETPLEGDQVFVERGGGLLGKCIDDFLDNVLEYMKERNYCKMFAFAHNGCAFDAILIKAFNTKYPMKNILVTSRGILSMTIQLEPGKLLVLRDTKVFFQARLSELCAVFKVPSVYCKTDFPITRVHARNFYDENVVKASEEYLKNDVYCLAFVVKGINETLEKIGDGLLIKNMYSPVITQYVTLMSAVKAHQAFLFEKKLDIPKPFPIDIPALRKWLNFSNVGGRTTAYWKGYASYCSKNIMYVQRMMWGGEDMCDSLKNLYRHMKEHKSYCQVLDVTSLYPYTMYAYPMPCESRAKIDWISAEEVDRRASLILDDVIGERCQCRQLWTLCESHRCGGEYDLRKLGFPIVVVEGAIRPPTIASPESERCLLNIIPRKVDGGGSLIYSMQDEISLKDHYNGSSRVAFPEASAVTIYDYFWMKKCGFTFEKVAGAFVFETSYAFRDDTLELFQKRIEAKRKEREEGLPKSLSTFFKFFINGRYGVNAQQDITSSMIITTEENEDNLRRDRKLKPDEVIVRNSNSHQCANGQWILKVEKVEGACDYYANQSPNHIGACVVACSRHHMNLAMFDLCKKEMVGYTDTDSLSAHGSALNPPEGSMDQSSEAAMGTYKNDHEEGKDEIIWLSFYITKKVKMHCTLDAEGIIRIYPTFKGYNPPAVDNETGRHRYEHEIDRDKVFAIVESFYEGEMPEVEQTEFRRDLQSGVTVDKNAKFSGKMESFMGHSAGSILKNYTTPLNVDAFEVLVPLGHSLPVHLNRDEKFAPYFKGDSQALKDVQNPVERKEYWEKRVPKKVFLEFIDHYYHHIDEEMGCKMDFVHAEEDYQAFDRVFSSAPQVSEEDRYWK